MRLEDANGSADGIWCVVANIKREHAHGPGSVQMKSGTRQFRGGTKVYIAGCFGGSCDGAIAIGLHREARRFITCVVHVKHLENFRAKLVYQPKVLKLIEQDERCRIKTRDEAEKWGAQFPEWQQLWKKTPLQAEAQDDKHDRQIEARTKKRTRTGSHKRFN